MADRGGSEGKRQMGMIAGSHLPAGIKVKCATRGVFLVCALAWSTAYAQADLNEAARVVYQQEINAASSRGDLVTEGADYERVQQITKKLIAVAPEMRADAGSWSWDVAYIHSSQENARCLPGGKMIVLTGLVERLSLNDDELAAVIGHEMGHALLEHGKEAYTQQQIAKVAVGILGIVAAIVGAKHHQDPTIAFGATTAIGSVGAEYFAIRPYSRERELAADAYGADLAARAGFDPRGAISLQQKLSTQWSIEFLNTHPASETRVQQLSQIVPAFSTRFASRHDQQSPVAVASSRPLESSVGAPPSGGIASTTSLSATQGSPQTDVRQPGAAAVASLAAERQGSTPEPDVVTGAAAAAMTSKYMFNAERYAKSHACLLPATIMTARAPTYESFTIKCSGGVQLVVRCDNGDCKTQD